MNFNKTYFVKKVKKELQFLFFPCKINLVDRTTTVIIINYSLNLTLN